MPRKKCLGGFGNCTKDYPSLSRSSLDKSVPGATDLGGDSVLGFGEEPTSPVKGTLKPLSTCHNASLNYESSRFRKTPNNDTSYRKSLSLIQSQYTRVLNT
ncbi:predicted protein [Sclerotinia sclerotiorum 1980 UF-70]|uniref:Uncharacterized protein n=1 Tax=Sclerotinia sclerotiorum (strain ATCC 18683 / 1980 / Ss-1) TaxID=665079 RepID=A7E606_SCLS1|nr:predicted protein [Sclerotinia sclerotiorum 1980 UF-70]EDN91328.1 predicted protein [Sclerotinia sclerotiorum 1980 UF-70]